MRNLAQEFASQARATNVMACGACYLAITKVDHLSAIMGPGGLGLPVLDFGSPFENPWRLRRTRPASSPPSI